MKISTFFRKHVVTMVMAAALCMPFLQPAATAYAAEGGDRGRFSVSSETVSAETETAETEAAETEAAETEEVPAETAIETEIAAETQAESALQTAETASAVEETDASPAEIADAIAETEAEAAAAENVPENRPLVQNQADDLIEFTFLTPATKVVLDGEPLMILPDTLTAWLSYYDSSGNVVEREIRYSSDAAQTGASWSALQYFLGTGSGALDPLYDAGTGGWYYMIRGSRYDVPVEEIQMSDSDAVELEYSEDYWGIDDEWPQGTVRLYKVVSNEALHWDDLHMNSTPSDTAYISRGSAPDSSCTFSTNDPLDELSHYTQNGETYYYANYYYGTKNRLLVDCRPSCSVGYVNLIDEVGTSIYLVEQSASCTPFTAFAEIPEEGWYRLNFTNYGLPSSAEITISFSTEVANEIFQANGAARNYLARRTEPVYLQKGFCVIQGDIRVNNPQNFYDGATLVTTLKKLGSGDILTKNLGLQQYGDHRDPWSWKSNGSEYDYGGEGLYFAPEKWPDYEGDMPSPASLTGRVSGDCLLFKYGNYMYTPNTGEKEYYPFSFCTKLPLSQMELDGTELLRYSLSDFGEITAQLLDPDGNAMDLTSTEEMAGGKYTLQMISKYGDTVMEEKNIPIWIPQKSSSCILKAEDFSIGYNADNSSSGDKTRVFTQSEEDPNEYFLEISRKYSRVYRSIDLLNRLTIPVSFEENETVFSGDTFIDGMTIGASMKEWTFEWAFGSAHDADDISPLYMAGLVSIYSKEDSDYLELHFYNQETGEEISEWWKGEMENGQYLLTVTSGIKHFEKKVHISVTGGPVKVESIKLSDTELTIRPGKWHQMTYELIPANTDYPEVKWESSDDNIVYVDNTGEIYGKNLGDATVTACAQNGEVTASCLVHVRKQGIDKLTLSETEVTLRPRETQQLEYQKTPADNDYPNVEWSSADESIATVDNYGEITAIGYGDTVITLHAQDGEVTATCKVHVVPYHVGSILLYDNGDQIPDGGSIEMAVGTGSGLGFIYLADADSEFWLEEEDLEGFQITVSNSNDAVISLSDVDSFGFAYETLKQGRSVVTVTVKGDGWQKTARFNIVVLFADVRDKSKYYYNPVYWAADKGITKGYRGWQFGVGMNCTREDLVTFLWRMEGKPTVTAAEKKKYHFSDVESGAYYENAIVWAAKKGITKGYSSGPNKGKFGVGFDVTREDTVTFLYRVAGKPAVSAADAKKYTFPDVKSTAYYAKPVAWAAKKGITKGYSSGPYKGKFGTGLKVLREDIVTFMYRYKH